MTDIRQAVREQYGKIAASERAGGGGCASSCCAGNVDQLPCTGQISEGLGYSAEELSALPEGADSSLGCGNPQAIATLCPGETVLDLGSGGGIDCFLAARQVGETGKVIGVDMTPEMIERARENATKAGVENVEFRLGEMEHLPVANETVDVILSNCVINLSPNKRAVFGEAFRVLKPGGRLAVSDIVATAQLPDEVRNDVKLHVGCVAGAATIDEIRSILSGAGFQDIQVAPIDRSRKIIQKYVPGSGMENYVVSATIEAVRP